MIVLQIVLSIVMTIVLQLTLGMPIVLSEFVRINYNILNIAVVVYDMTRIQHL